MALHGRRRRDARRILLPLNDFDGFRFECEGLDRSEKRAGVGEVGCVVGSVRCLSSEAVFWRTGYKVTGQWSVIQEVTEGVRCPQAGSMVVLSCLRGRYRRAARCTTVIGSIVCQDAEIRFFGEPLGVARSQLRVRSDCPDGG
jgi:hypothetical protein